MATSRWDDKRTNRRLTLEAAVGLNSESGILSFLSTRPRFHGTLRNASISGCQILSRHPIGEGVPISLWIQVHTQGKPRTLKLRGVVVWARPHDATGSYALGIKLHCNREEPLKVWTATMLEELRRHDE